LTEHLASSSVSPLNFGPYLVLQHTAWWDHLCRQAPALGFCFRVHFVAYILAVYTVPPDATPEIGNLLVFGTFE